MKIAVCITTKDRPEVFDKTYSMVTKYLPSNAKRFIVDDGSHEPIIKTGVRGHRFEKSVGIPRAKNKCLQLAYEWGADHIFLFDDDCYPIAEDWWSPYVESREPHLMYIFTGFGNQTKGIKELYRDDKIVAYDHLRGCMLYADRRVLDVVGGMDTDFTNGMYEHSDWTNRIHNAGLTTFRVMDVPNSSRLIYSMDEHQEVVSTFTPAERLLMIRKNKPMKIKKSHSKDYKEFRT